MTDEASLQSQVAETRRLLNQAIRELRRYYRTQGRCVHCGRPAVTVNGQPRSRCAYHLRQARVSTSSARHIA